MKRFIILLCASLLAASAPLAPAQSDDSVSIDFFYDALSPYGDWIYTPNYGYVWQPLAAGQPGWSPYADGSWAFTDAGWTWISNEDFGWLTYHYGRWIRMQQNWVWVPGYEWAPAWVSWRQTQGQIGWAPLPPEAAWVPDIGFGGWTDSYYDVGPAYYNFVPIGAFASRTSLRPFILDRSRNFNFYDQSVNVTHMSYQQNVLHHIFVGGPDPQRIDSLGSNHVRRLTLRHDEEGFRRDWLDQKGGRERGKGGLSRIEQDHLIVAAPSIRRDASHGLPSRVREPLQQPEIDRGWRGAAGDAQSADRLRQHQRDELARTRPPNLPEKNVRPATSTVPPPAFGRVLQPEERIGSGGPRQSGPRHMTEEVRPATVPPVNGPPGIPGKKAEAPGSRGTMPQAEIPHRERRGEDQPPGRRPGPNGGPPSNDAPQTRPGFPPGPQGVAPQPTVPPKRTEPQVPGAPPKRTEPQAPTAPSKRRPTEPQAPTAPPKRAEPQAPTAPPKNTPNAPAVNPGFPGRQGQRPGQRPGPSPERPSAQRPAAPPAAPVAPPRVSPAPMPPAQPRAPRIQPQPPPRGNAPPMTPVAPPPNAPPANPAQNPGPRGKKH